MRNGKFRLSFLLAISMFGLLLCPSAGLGSTILNTIYAPNTEFYRVLAGTQPDQYWVVDSGAGLRLLAQDQLGNWSLSNDYGCPLYDAVGPNQQGLIFTSSGLQDSSSGLCIFNSSSRTVVDSVSLGPDYPIRSLCISSDGGYVYMLGWDWPRVGQSGSFFDSGGHRDSGIIWKIDTSTFAVVDQGITAALPETIFYADSESGPRLFVSTQEIAAWNTSMASAVDIISSARGLPRENQMLSPRNTEDDRNDFIKWSDTEPLVAMCCGVDTYMHDPQYMAGLWIINTDLAQVVNRLTITFNGRIYGVRHACVSRVYPSDVDIVPDIGTPEELFIIDKDTGAVTGTIPLPTGFNAEFIYEIPYGRLIVTGGESGKILIIDPT